ncbi:transposase [bacterium]|nr:transposase [bacterium]
MKSPELVISDEAKGIASALKLEYPHSERQICTFHKVKNIQFHLNDSKNRKSIMKEATDIYEFSKNKTEAISKLNLFEKNWKDGTVTK